jgi:hypothetical protein
MKQAAKKASFLRSIRFSIREDCHEISDTCVLVRGRLIAFYISSLDMTNCCKIIEIHEENLILYKHPLKTKK